MRETKSSVKAVHRGETGWSAVCPNLRPEKDERYEAEKNRERGLQLSCCCLEQHISSGRDDILSINKIKKRKENLYK
jgi:hypothetical protein